MASATLSNRVDPGWARPKAGKAARTGSSKRQFDEPVAVVDATSSASQSQYVSFDLRSRSRKELGEIKTRLVAELDRIQRLRQRIDSGELAAARSGRNPKSTAKKAAGSAKRPSGSEIGESGGGGGAPARSLGPVLSRLMKHKHAWIFNSPVDAAALGLHDYHDVVKRPMDLGTVKANVAKNLYSSPIDFADDVRLTFNNAMLYNPKGHEIYHIAEELLARFEELFKPVYEKLGDDHRPDHQVYEDLPANSCSNVEPERTIKEVAPPIVKKTLPASSWTELEPENVKAKKKKQKVGKRSEQARARSPARVQVKTVKQPKPKAKDPNKREMSLEEKHKLGVGLQSLPEEKMEQVVQIISKRNGHLRHDGDEIELDIEAVDTETLWELDRFVTNWKKLVSKIKRQALMNNNGGSGSGSVGHNEEVPQIEIVDAEMSTRSPNEGEGGNEDVDIDDDLPRDSYGPVEIEKEGGRGGAGGRASSSSSSSSSSGSDSSSSSDSDSGSSSGSEDKAHS